MKHKVRTKYPIDNGKITFQARYCNRSYLNLGTVALINTMTNTIKNDLKAKTNGKISSDKSKPGIVLPPKNKYTIKND